MEYNRLLVKLGIFGEGLAQAVRAVERTGDFSSGFPEERECAERFARKF